MADPNVNVYPYLKIGNLELKAGILNKLAQIKK